MRAARRPPRRRSRSTLAACAALAGIAACRGRSAPPEPAVLGERIFYDPALSRPPGQACADCHAPEAYFRDPESDHTTSAGVQPGTFGARNAPSLLYARYVPDLERDPTTHEWRGGLFWDGRGGSLEKQAAFPLLNPVEMNNPDKQTVVTTVAHEPYAADLRARYGANALDGADLGFSHVSDAIAAFERTPAFAPFSSKYDRYLAGAVALTDSEARGLAIFEDPHRGNCAGCHPSRPSADGTPPLFTNFGYANLGIPHYGNSLFYSQSKDVNPAGEAYVDHGLMTTVHEATEDGKFRTPTLRNIARTPPYGHNGYFENLPYMLDFLNTRDVGSRDRYVGAWMPPEVAANVDQRVGHLGLTDRDVEDLDAFLETLTDDQPRPSAYAKPPPPPPSRRR